MASFLKKIIGNRPLVISILTTLIGCMAYFSGVPFLDLMELKTNDLRFKYRGEISPGSEVVLAVIDEKSVNKEGKWVWPRTKMADLITKLSDAGARVIAFDVGFLEPDDKKVVLTINKIENKLQKLDIRDTTFERYLESIKLQSDQDRLLADAIKNSSARVVLGYFFHMGRAETTHLDEKEIRLHQENLRGASYKFVRYASSNSQNVPLLEAQVPQSNIKIVSDATDYAGFFNMMPDNDGVVRWIPAVIKFREMMCAPLSLMTLSAYLKEDLSVNVAEYGIEAVNIGKLSVPTDEMGRVLINYRGQKKTFPHISITDILHDNIADSEVKDKIVMVGATAVGIYDLRVTPFGSVFPGLEIHANMVDTILSKDFLYQPGWAAIFDMMAIIGAGLLLGFVLSRGGVISGGIAALSLFIGHILLCHYFFSAKGVILNLIYPLTVILLTYISITAYRYFTESKQKVFIKNAFSTYLAPSVVKHLMDSPENLVLGGEDRVITAFFSDVEGFTSISEKLTPTELVELLNEFLTEMTGVIFDYEGTVDKFEGDAIIAFFGAPNEIENQAEVACTACLVMQDKLKKLREKWKTEGKPELKMRIGLCTGHAVVGNMGSKTRMDYTMMGDTVNTAARLEGVNKVYGNYTLISDTTYNATNGRIIAREIDAIKVVGKKEPVTIYQPIGYSEDVDERALETIDHYHKGLYAYRDQDWDKAIELFTAVLDCTPDDGPSKTMIERCNEFKINPPGKDWDGSFSMTSK